VADDVVDELGADPRPVWLAGEGIRVHGLDWGPERAARLALLLHGVAGNAHAWDAVGPLLRTRLDGAIRLVALDGRDGGLTEHPVSGYLVDDFGADLIAVHEALGGVPLTLIGHSRGGWLATWFAARHPERLEALVLVDPARLAFGAGAAASFYASVRRSLGPFASRDEALSWARAEDPLADWNEVRVATFLAGFEVQADGSLRGRFPAAAVDHLRAAREREEGVGNLLSSIECPVLLLVATRQSAERQAEKLAYASGIRDIRVELVDGSHFLHTDAPERVAELIGGFLGERS
jgi:pimeloyl-ACP methyl ester carboxylesterase